MYKRQPKWSPYFGNIFRRTQLFLQIKGLTQEFRNEFVTFIPNFVQSAVTLSTYDCVCMLTTPACTARKEVLNPK
jgi:hypothetical protein